MMTREAQNQAIIRRMVEEIRINAKSREFTFMEVCGTHTMAIHRHGLRSLLPENIRLISGPGCPVCVTASSFIDWAVVAAQNESVILATFGDLIRVPGSYSSLETERRNGKDIRILYSAMDALDLAAQNPDRLVIFLGIGFETTAPTIAATVLAAAQRHLENFLVLSAHKTMPNALAALVQSPELRVDGFICPGHVSAIIGAEPYRFLARNHGRACVVAGFEPLDLLRSILMLIRQIVAARPTVEIQYRRLVKPEGNPKALALMDRVFAPVATEWRGLGTIPQSGLELRSEWQKWNARQRLSIQVPPAVEPTGCICGAVLRGVKTPAQCPLFARKCTPENPVGACMVSSEGSCAAFYKYSRSAAEPNRPAASF